MKGHHYISNGYHEPNFFFFFFEVMKILLFIYLFFDDIRELQSD